MLLSKASPWKYSQGLYFHCFLQPRACMLLIISQTHVVLPSEQQVHLLSFYVEQSSARKKPEVCVFTPLSSRISFGFGVHQIFGSITITLLSSYLSHSAIQNAKCFLFERLWILVPRSPTAYRNNASTCTEQFVFYLQVHLRLCTGRLNLSQFISSSVDLLRKGLQIDFGTRFEGGGGGTACTPRIRGLFPF